MDIKEIESVVESLLFASGDALSLDKMCEIIEVDRKTLKNIISSMIVKYNNSSRGIMIREIDDGYQLCTKPDYHEYIAKLFVPRQKQGLSQAAFETLAIIAYNQPVTRAKIESLRGVNSESSITRLLERNLIKEAGRLDAPGKPILYETTEEFLRCFGFSSLKDLPLLGMVGQEK
ncbi:MAG TPA: SMC-Scp complex subunit ScpB [Clostridiaceae bacterium]|jgi:segregation and condensation protein B|nr:SMC-Scp complex subunit ScpB [Clostridiaceae bacterium]